MGGKENNIQRIERERKMKLLIGTKNPVKIEAVKEAFEKYFSEIEIEGISVDSEVGDQPSDRQITIGA